MNIEDVRYYALSLPGATEDMPYGPDVLVFRIGGKIFLHLWLNAPSPSCAVKLPPDQGEELRAANAAIAPAWHLNKRHWNDLFLDHLPDNLVRNLIDTSHQFVLSKLPKALRATLV